MCGQVGGVHPHLQTSAMMRRTWITSLNGPPSRCTYPKRHVQLPLNGCEVLVLGYNKDWEGEMEEEPPASRLEPPVGNQGGPGNSDETPCKLEARLACTISVVFLAWYQLNNNNNCLLIVFQKQSHHVSEPFIYTRHYQAISLSRD